MVPLPEEPLWTEAHSALRGSDVRRAQIALARHFSERRSAFPLDAIDVPARASFVRESFPSAKGDAVARADALVRGEYDVLGYRGIRVGPSIDWHRDPINRRDAPKIHWSILRYLDPAYGDHKIIWEFNRHQHWLTLGRAYALTDDRKYYELFRGQLESWVTSNPPGRGINWASMLELGFRTISWLWAIAFFAAPACADGDDEPWLVDALLGIDRQMRHVEQNLSLYFSPNTHLTGEALALYVTGCALPGLKSSGRWTSLGRDVLLREAHAQILADGGHAELSGHYHRYSTDFYLLALSVARAAADPAAAAFEDAARNQARYLRAIADDRGHRPSTGDDDGGQLFPICGRRPDDCADTLAIAAILLNDRDLAVSPVPEEAVWRCGNLARELVATGRGSQWPSTALRESGYCVSRNARGDHLLFDAGRHGFLNGGHAHADALSITLTVAGRPLFVDPGTATYITDPEVRDRFRSSAMHNTLVLDGRQQSEPAGPFHWRSRANAQARVWRSSGPPDGADYIEASHDGYAPRQHVRSVLAIDGLGWWILDAVLGRGEGDAVTYWHVHPDWRATPGERHVLLEHQDGFTVALAASGEAILHPAGTTPLAFWSPEYGRVEPAPTVAIRVRGTFPITLATFVPARPEFTADLTVEPLSVSDVPSDWLGVGWRAAWRRGESALVAAVGVRDTTASWVPTVWGSTDVETDGRLACVVRSPLCACAVVIDGAQVSAQSRRLLSAQPEVRDAIVRRRITDMAPLVHEPDIAELRVQ